MTDAMTADSRIIETAQRAAELLEAGVGEFIFADADELLFELSLYRAMHMRAPASDRWPVSVSPPYRTGNDG